MKIKLLVFLAVTLPLLGFSAKNSILDSLKLEYEKSRIDTDKILLLGRIAWEQKYDDPERFYELTEEIMDRSNAIQYQKGVAIAYGHFGIYHYIKDNYFKALDNYEYALKIYNDLEDKKNIAKIYNHRGLVYEDINHPNNAIKEYLESLKIKEELNDKPGIANTINNIGVLHLHQKNYEEARKYFDRSLLIYLDLKDDIGVAYSYNNIGIIYDETGEIDKAIEYYLKSLKIEEKIKNNKQGLALSYNNLGSAYSKANKMEVAHYYYEMALPLYKEIGSKSGLSLVNNNIADAYNQTENLDKSVAYSTKALEFATEINHHEYKGDAFLNLYKTYKKQKNFEKALHYKELLDHLNDSIQLSKSDIEISALKAQYDYELKKKDEERKKSISARKHTRKIAVYALSAIELLLLIVIITAYFKFHLFTWIQLRIALFSFGLFGYEIIFLKVNPMINWSSWDRPIAKIVFHFLLVVFISIVYQRLYSLFIRKKKEVSS